MAHSSTHLIGSPATDIPLCLFALVMRECRPLKLERPSTPSSTASPSITKDVFRFRSAASDISGNRSVQSWPLRVNSRTRLPSR
jgi:hypothetical protein